MEQNLGTVVGIFVIGAIVCGFIFQKKEGGDGVSMGLVVLALGGVGLVASGKYAVGLMLMGPVIVALVGVLSYVAWCVHRKKSAKEREERGKK